MRKAVAGLCVFMFVVSVFAGEGYCSTNSSSDLLRQGLLGAASGAAGGAASGAKGKDVWKGALAGAGVNIVGGALLDSMSGEKVDNTSNVDTMSSRDAYSDGYNDGYRNGYKQGYTEGLRDGMKEAYVSVNKTAAN